MTELIFIKADVGAETMRLLPMGCMHSSTKGVSAAFQYREAIYVFARQWAISLLARSIFLKHGVNDAPPIASFFDDSM
jgi:hypothetical protein